MSFCCRLSLAGDVDTESSGNTREDLFARLVESAGGENEELGKLKSRIKLTEAFSGIKFKSVDWEVKHTGTMTFITEC